MEGGEGEGKVEGDRERERNKMEREKERERGRKSAWACWKYLNEKKEGDRQTDRHR